MFRIARNHVIEEDIKPSCGLSDYLVLAKYSAKQVTGLYFSYTCFGLPAKLGDGWSRRVYASEAHVRHMTDRRGFIGFGMDWNISAWTACYDVDVVILLYYTVHLTRSVLAFAFEGVPPFAMMASYRYNTGRWQMIIHHSLLLLLSLWARQQQKDGKKKSRPKIFGYGPHV